VCLFATQFVLGAVLAQSQVASVAYQGDAAHDGNIAMTGFQPYLHLAWTADIGATVSYPIVSGNNIIVTAGDNTSNTVKVYCLNASDGSQAWVPYGIKGTYNWGNATVDDGNIFAVNTSGGLTSLNAATGAENWSVMLPGQNSFSAAPTASNGMVYVGGAGDGGTLYGVNESNGKVAWTGSVEDGDMSSPTASSTGVYVGYAGNQDYDFNPTTGVQIWHYIGPGEGGGGKTTVLYNGQLYTRDSSAGNLVLDASTGAEVDTYSSNTAPAFSDGIAYYIQGSTLVAFNTATKITLWSQGLQMSGSSSWPVTAPFVVNGTVFVGTDTGVLYGFNATSGAIADKINVGSTIYGPNEQDVEYPLTGLGAGDGLLLVPVGNTLFAFASTPAPPALTLFAGGLCALPLLCRRTARRSHNCNPDRP